MNKGEVCGKLKGILKDMINDTPSPSRPNKDSGWRRFRKDQQSYHQSEVVRNFIEEMIRQYHDQWDADYDQAKPRRDEVLLLHDSGKNIREICRITGLFPESVRRLVEGFQDRQIDSV